MAVPGDEPRFRTAEPGPFTFLVIGDSGQGTPEQQLIVERMNQENASLVLHSGDIAYPNRRFDEFQAFYFDYYVSLMKAPAVFSVFRQSRY